MSATGRESRSSRRSTSSVAGRGSSRESEASFVPSSVQRGNSLPTGARFSSPISEAPGRVLCTPMNTRALESPTPAGSSRQQTGSQVVIPRREASGSEDAIRARCLTPLNLGSLLNQETRGSDISGKLEAFFARQHEFNERLEQRIAEAAELRTREKERENEKEGQRKLSKALSESHHFLGIAELMNISFYIPSIRNEKKLI